LQQLNRDTHKFAFKCSAIDRNGVWHDVYKDPITDTGKRSKRGRLGLVRSGDEFKTVAEREAYPDPFYIS
jgi:nicotinamide phosphoribosyltransferase